MTDSEFGLYVAGPIMVVIGLVMYFLLRKPKPSRGNPASLDASQPEPAPNPEVLATLMGAITAQASRFDRDMYIDDMTEDQLEYEYTYRTVYILASLLSRKTLESVTYAVTELVTGQPADKQLYGLSEYYADTDYEQMCIKGDDRYWQDVLAPLSSMLSKEKKVEIIVSGFLVDELYRKQKNSEKTEHFYVPEALEECIKELNGVAQVWFGADSDHMISKLRGQAQDLVPQLEARIAN